MGKMTEHQMNFLTNYIGWVDRETKLAIGRVLVENGYRDRLIKCATGTVVNLNKIDPATISRMYQMLRDKINEGLAQYGQPPIE